jgi:inosine-uridine nucleoside N-ribohydrolase
MRAIIVATSFITALAILVTPTGAFSHGGTRIVVDTDMGLDDARALFALLADDALDVEAIIVTEGAASSERGLANLFGLLEAAGKAGIPVFAGTRLDGAPPWRETADALAGFSPATRGDARKPLPLEELPALLAEEGDVVWLALGPLGSLASLARGHAEAFGRIETIYIPARIGDGPLGAWNLNADPRAAKIVFERARAIVIVDVSAGLAAVEGLLASILRDTPAARFARNTLAGHGADPHAFLYDELAAACAIDHSIASTDGKRFRSGIRGDSLALEPDTRGNVVVARIDEPKAAAEVLRSRWESVPHGHDALPGDDIPVARLLSVFHGHLGPYVVLGYRMGRLALEATGTDGHFDVSAEVHSYLEPPRSCLIDGVQLGTGCTLGKRNIELAPTDGPAYGIFTAKNGARAVVRLRAEVPALIDSLIRTIGVERAGERMLEAAPEDIFTIETPDVGK